MVQAKDGGEAILEAFRNLDIDYIISSPGSEWAPVWEALARQKINETEGPAYINCWHETLAVDMALGYTRITGKLQAVLLHAGVGLLQGGIGIHGASLGEVPMLICSGEANSYGENPELDPQGQWYRNLSVVGGPNRFVEPFTKWSGQATSPYTLYEQLVRAGEMAQRIPKGPTFLDIPIETMIHDWSPPSKIRKVPPAPKVQPAADSVGRLVELLAKSANPLIITESAGREPAGFQNLVELAELLAIPVVESSPTYSNFRKATPCTWDSAPSPILTRQTWFWYWAAGLPGIHPVPDRTKPRWWLWTRPPIKGQMVYQNLLADLYVEGDLTLGIGLLIEGLRSHDAVQSEAIKAAVRERGQRWEAEHDRLQERNRAAETGARTKHTIDPILLCAALSEVMPENAIYVEETTSHRTAILRHVQWEKPPQLPAP